MVSLHYALLVALLVCILAWRARTLTFGGAVAAFLIGALVLAGTGLGGGAARGVFFLSSSLVSRFTEGRQAAWVDAKGNQRDAWQVGANGGVAAVGGLLGFANLPLGLWIVTCSLAAAAADTWATSLGVLARRDPRHVLRWSRVPKGTSGGVSLLGTLGGVAGAMAVAAAPLGAGVPIREFALAAAIGTLGMLADSVLGATVQGRFRCPTCQMASERRQHRCGTRTEQTGGIRWIGNDGVNAIATALAGLAGWAWWAWWA